MSDFDPVLIDMMPLTESRYEDGEPMLCVGDVPQLMANELRRLYEEQGDPGTYFLVLRAQELESL